MILAILASLIFWPIYIAVDLALTVIGMVILLPMSLGRAWVFRPSKVWPGSRIVDAWRGGWLTWIWGNEEDGVAGADWYIREKALAGWAVWRIAYVWSAWRNSANNLRFVPFINPVIEPKRVRFVGGTHWSFTWQGLYAGLTLYPVIRGRVFRFWIGWKLKPGDTIGVPDDDVRKVRCGFALQFKALWRASHD